MASPETGPRPEREQEGEPQPEEEGSTLKSQEAAEKPRLNPEHATQNEQERLGGVLTGIAERMKRVPKEAKLALAVFIGASALTFGQGSFQPAEAGGQRGSAHSSVEDVGERFGAEADRIWKKFSKEGERMLQEHKQTGERMQREVGETAERWQREVEQTREKYQQEIERLRKQFPPERKGMRERFSKEVTARTLEYIKSTKEYPSKNAAQKLIMEDEGMRTTLFNYAGIRTGKTEEVTSRDAQEGLNELRDTLYRSFDANGDGTLDRSEMERYENAVKNNQGLSVMQRIQLYEVRR